MYDIGQHCQEKGCNQLDFLPFHCKGCNKDFCKLHRHTVDCKNNVVEEIRLPKIQVYPCTHKRCKAKALTVNICMECGLHFCIKHRYHDMYHATAIA